MSTIIPFTPTEAQPYFNGLRAKKPLIHCMTNDVVQHFTANVLLAIGAVPAMVIAKEEVENFVAVADGLLINIGTLHDALAKSMLLAAASAEKKGTPWVLDPVAVGPTLTYRTDIANALLNYKPTVIRANAAEILALSGEKSLAKGPDSQDSSASALDAAKRMAQRHQTVIALTGKVDYITNGSVTYSIAGGDEALTRVTGTGCSLSAIVAAFNACSSQTLLATAAACLLMKKAGERADKQPGLGSYAVSLLDRLSSIDTLAN